MIEAERLTVSVAGRALLSEVSLTAKAGEVTALVGPNGAGKTTLLRALAGDVRSEGNVRVAGAPIAGMKAAQLARARAVVEQHWSVPAGLRAVEIVLLGRYAHVGRGETRSDELIARKALARLDAEHLAERRFDSLSGGEQQRVHVARALAQMADVEAPVFLLDEPTASLDLSHAHALLEIARDEARRGATVVVVLHDLSLASRYAHRIVMLDRGHVVSCGTARETLSRDRVATVFRLRSTVIEHEGAEIVVPLARIGGLR